MKSLSTVALIVTLDLQAVSCFLSPTQKHRRRMHVSVPSKSPLSMVVNERSVKDDGTVDTKTTSDGSKVNGNYNSSSSIINGENLNADLMSEGTSFSSASIISLLEDVNKQIIDGSNQLFQNMTEIVEDKLLESVPVNGSGDTGMQNTTRWATYDSDSLSKTLSDLTNDIQKAQQQEIQRQLDEIERLLVRPFEDFAFSDAALVNLPSSDETLGELRNKNGDDELSAEERKRKLEEHRRELVIAGVNSTLAESSRRLRTKEIVRNLNVAPFYYSVTLLARWFRKVSAPPLALLTFLKGTGDIFTTGSSKMSSYDDFMKDGDSMQAGWKRTGEIAAKGKVARKWAILRRSMEIWAYFSSFYVKERRMAKLYESGRWTAEKYSEERSKLGAEITQNLLKLGPTFIKVSVSLREIILGMKRRTFVLIILRAFFLLLKGRSTLLNKN